MTKLDFRWRSTDAGFTSGGLQRYHAWRNRSQAEGYVKPPATRTPPPKVRNDLPASFFNMTTRPANSFSWRHDSSVPLDHRVSPSNPNSKSNRANEIRATRELEELRNRMENDLREQELVREAQHNDEPSVAVRGVPVWTPRLAADPDVPIVACEVVDVTSSFLPPLAPPICSSPSQDIAVALNNKRLEPCIWLSLAAAVADRPDAPGWYLARDPHDAISGGEDFVVEWERLRHQEQIDAAFEDKNEKSIMLYSGNKIDDMKVDFSRMYVKGRGGSRRPVIYIAGNTASSSVTWEYSYEGRPEWHCFDANDAAFLERTRGVGRRGGLVYDGNSCIEFDLVANTWVNALYSCGCDVEQSLGQIRRIVSEDAVILMACAVVVSEMTIVAATNTSAKAPADAGDTVKIGKLKEMGFAEGVARRALANANGSLDAAINSLLS